MRYWQIFPGDGNKIRRSRNGHMAIGFNNTPKACFKYHIVSFIISTTTPEGSDCCIYFSQQVVTIVCGFDDPTNYATLNSTPSFPGPDYPHRVRRYCDGDCVGSLAFGSLGGSAQIAIPGAAPHGWQADTIYVPSIASPSSTFSCYSRVDEFCWPEYPDSLPDCGGLCASFQPGSTCRTLVPDVFDGYEGCIPSVLA